MTLIVWALQSLGLSATNQKSTLQVKTYQFYYLMNERCLFRLNKSICGLSENGAIAIEVLNYKFYLLII